MSYRNNLQKGDRVLHADTKAPGTVEANPRENAVCVGVVWQGFQSVRYVHISKLRLVVDGKAETVPPCDGEPPERGPRSGPTGRAPSPATLYDDPTEVLRLKREANLREQAELNKRFSALKAENDRIDVALKALAPL